MIASCDRIDFLPLAELLGDITQRYNVQVSTEMQSYQARNQFVARFVMVD